MNQEEISYLDIAQMIQREFSLATICGDIYKKNGSFYEKVEEIFLNNTILKTCEQALPRKKIKASTVKDINYQIHCINPFVASNINPLDKYCFKNGELVLDKNTGGVSFNQSVSSLYTIYSDINYDPSVSTAHALDFLQQIIPNKNEFQWVLEGLAIALFPALRDIVNYDAYFIFYGVGANGKSALCDGVIRPIFGSNATSSITIDRLSERFAVAGLVAKRINIATENKSNKIDDNEIIKKLTTGEIIEIEPKHKPAYDIKLIAVPIFCINEEPYISDRATYAIKRRCRIVTFPKKFSDNPKEANEIKANPAYRNANSNESRLLQQSLLNLILQTAQALCISKKMTANNDKSFEDYQKNSSHHMRFIEEYFDFDLTSRISSSDLFRYYEQYCKSERYLADGKWIDPSPWDKVTKTPRELTTAIHNAYRDKLIKADEHGDKGWFGLKPKDGVKLENAGFPF